MQQTQSKTSCKIFNDTLCNIHTLHTFQHASGPVIYFRLQTHRENTRNKKKKYIYEFDAATLRRVYNIYVQYGGMNTNRTYLHTLIKLKHFWLQIY